MLKKIRNYVVLLCLLLFCLCAYATQEYPYPSDDLAVDVVRQGSVIDKAVLTDQGNKNEFKKDARSNSNDPGGGTGGGQMALSAKKSSDVELDSSSGISGLSVHTQYIIIAIVCSVVAFAGIVIAISCWCRLHNRSKGELSSASGNYSGYGVTGPASNTMYFHESGDRKLAQSAQMYHYQHQKQQMIDMEKANGETKADATDEESEAENEEDFTVYEIPGLAQGGDMEVHNPLFKGQVEDTNGDSKPPEGGKDK